MRQPPYDLTVTRASIVPNQMERNRWTNKPCHRESDSWDRLRRDSDPNKHWSQITETPMIIGHRSDMDKIQRQRCMNTNHRNSHDHWSDMDTIYWIGCRAERKGWEKHEQEIKMCLRSCGAEWKSASVLFECSRPFLVIKRRKRERIPSCQLDNVVTLRRQSSLWLSNCMESQIF